MSMQEPVTLRQPQMGVEPYLLFDRADDEGIIARIRGAALKRYVYHFKQGGQEIYGLGIDGAEACKRELARAGEVLEEDDVQIERDEPEAAYFKARCSRWAANKEGKRIKLDSTLGMKRQAKFITRRDGTIEPNPFWFEQGCSKAIRNAILNLTPMEIQERVIEAFKGKGQVIDVTMTPDAAGEMLEDAHAAFNKARGTPDEEKPAILQAVRLAAAKLGKQRADKIKIALGIDPETPLDKLDVAALAMLRDHLK